MHIAGMKERLKRSVRMYGRMNAHFRLVLYQGWYLGVLDVMSNLSGSPPRQATFLHVNVQARLSLTEPQYPPGKQGLRSNILRQLSLWKKEWYVLSQVIK